MRSSFADCFYLRATRGLLLVLTVVALAAVFASSRAQGEEVNFCFNNWAPYMYVQDGSTRGLSVRILDEAARRSGLTAVYHERPWKRCLHLVGTGEIDAVVDAAARPEFLCGPASYNVYSNTFWVQKESPLRDFQLEGLRGKTVGLVTGYSYPKELVKDTPYSIDYSVDDATLLRKLVAGRVDAVVADLASTRWMVAEQNLAVRPLLPSHSLDLLYPSFGKGRTAMHARLNEALEEMRSDGFIHKVYREFLDLDFDEVTGAGK